MVGLAGMIGSQNPANQGEVVPASVHYRPEPACICVILIDLKAFTSSCLYLQSLVIHFRKLCG